MYKKNDRITQTKKMAGELCGIILVVNLKYYICMVHI